MRGELPATSAEGLLGYSCSLVVWSAATRHLLHWTSSEPGLRGELPATGADVSRDRECGHSGLERSDREE